jgi:nucleotide-binding universal stress UspA family protein
MTGLHNWKKQRMWLSPWQSVCMRRCGPLRLRGPEPSTPVELEAVPDHAKEHVEDGFKKHMEKTGGRDLPVTTDMAGGHRAEQIIHRAEVDGIDLIIFGRRRRSIISRMRLGSVSERALRYAHCPVMVVH